MFLLLAEREVVYSGASLRYSYLISLLKFRKLNFNVIFDEFLVS